MKLRTSLLPFLFLLLLFSCASPSNEPLKIDCTETPQDAPEKVPPPAFPGTVYHFHEGVDPSTCMLRDDKDSVGWDLVFVNDSEFVQVNYFPADMFIKKGTYRWENDSLSLRYDTVRVSRIHSKVTSTVDELMKDAPIKTVPVTPSNNVDIGKPSVEKLTVHKCEEGTVYLNWNEPMLTQLMPADDGVKTDVTASDYVKRLKEAGVWELLYKK